MSSYEPSKTSGQIKSTTGTAKEMAGQAIGTVAPETGASLQQSGSTEHMKGEGETKAAQAQGYVEGLVDKAMGTKDSIVGAVTGSDTQKAAGSAKEKKGDTKMAVNKGS